MPDNGFLMAFYYTTYNTHTSELGVTWGQMS